MSLDSLCNNTANIKRKTTTAADGGGQVQVESTPYANVRCTIQPARGSVIERFARRSMVISHTLYTPASLVLLADDTVESADGRVFQVKSFGDMAGRGVASAVYLNEVS